MRAVKYYGPGHMAHVTLEKPEPGPGQVLVQVVYCGICGTDIHAYKMPGIFDWELIPGHESVGIVAAVGEGVTEFKAGDRVAVGPPGDCGQCYSCNTGHPNRCANAFPNTLGIGPGTQGAYAEYVLSHYPKNELFRIPDNVTMEQAVLFDVLGVGLHGVRCSQLRVGDHAVVAGCGSIGLSVIQFAKMAGAGKLIAFDPKPDRRALALQAGADLALDPDSPEDIQKAKEIFNHAGGAQVAFEAAGHPSSVALCVELTMAGGQIMLIGSDGRPYELVTAALGPKEYDLKFSFTYTKEEIHTLFELIDEGKLATDIYSLEKAPLSEAIDKIEALARGEISAARVLLMPGEETPQV